ncbi:hypothetical protein V2J09_023321 [Rumex salicifolius]
MGSACCCLRGESFEDFISRNGVYRNCICFNCFLQNFFHMYTSLFGREVPAITSSVQGANALTSPPTTDHSLSDMYRSPPRPLPYDADPRYLRLQRHLVSRREKGSTHLHEESDSLITGDKWSSYEDGSKDRQKSSAKLSMTKSANDVAYVYSSSSSSEDEDVCPTCLEEYTTENPKIMTKCSHHFHLGCIYEWMERSENCPVCGKCEEKAAYFLSYCQLRPCQHYCKIFLITSISSQKKIQKYPVYQDLEFLSVFNYNENFVIGFCWYSLTKEVAVN